MKLYIPCDLRGLIMDPGGTGVAVGVRIIITPWVGTRGPNEKGVSTGLTTGVTTGVGMGVILGVGTGDTVTRGVAAGVAAGFTVAWISFEDEPPKATLIPPERLCSEKFVMPSLPW